MKLSRFLTTLFIFTIFSLVYIELQVQIYDLGYKGENKKTCIQKLMDDNSDLVYNIYKLKSANHLGVTLLSDSSKMKFLDDSHIIKLETPTQLLDNSSLDSVSNRSINKKPNLLASIFTLKSQAEAEPIK